MNTNSSRAFIEIALATAIGIAGIALSCNAFGEQASVFEAVKNGKVKVALRYRYESVDQDNALDDAHASTLKSRLTYTTAKFSDFQARVEVDDVTVLGGDNHNDTANGITNHSVVADPEGTDINQAWLTYTGLEDNRIRYGRQRINLNNQRFIGGVGWRQNEQTYDGVTLVNTNLADSTLVYAFIDNVNRIFGPDDGAVAADLDTSMHLLNFKYKGLPFGVVGAYGYWLDVEDVAPLSTRTLGIRFDGKSKAGDIDVLYRAEFATQSDFADNTGSYDVSYYVLEGGVKVSGITAKLGLEVLEGNDTNAIETFRTPFATLHKFNGWADQFLNTPTGGLEDFYATVSGAVLGVKVTGVYHQFDAQDGSGNWGDEIDLAVAKKITNNLKVLFKYANYDAKDFSVDTEKLWLQVQVTF